MNFALCYMNISIDFFINKKLYNIKINLWEHVGSVYSIFLYEIYVSFYIQNEIILYQISQINNSYRIRDA